MNADEETDKVEERDLEKCLTSSIEIESMHALMAGLSFFYPRAEDLAGLLSSPWRKVPLVMTSLAAIHEVREFTTGIHPEDLTNLLHQDKIDQAIGSGGFLCLLLELVQSEGIEQLEALASADDDSSASSSSSSSSVENAIISPGLRLLLSLQGFILVKIKIINLKLSKQ